MRKTFCFLCFLLCVDAWAAEVVLKNGDRVTGKIIRMNKTSLDLDTELMGKVSVPWNAVVKIQSETPVYVSAGDDETTKGIVSMSDGQLEVRPKDRDAVGYPRDAVRAIRSEDEQHAFVSQIKPRQPGFLHLWGGSLDAAISATRGNADTKTFNFGMRAARTTERNKLSLYLISIFSDSMSAKSSARIADAVRGGSRYEVNFSRRLFTFGFTDLEHDQFQSLDSRIVGGGGLGVNLVKTSKTTLQVFSGGSANREHFHNGVKRQSREFVAGNDFSRQLNPVTSFTESLVMYPNLSSRGEYRVTFDSSVVTRLNSWLAWHITASSRYTSNPAAGKKNNDLLLTTGIRFVHRGETLQNVEARPELRRR